MATDLLQEVQVTAKRIPTDKYVDSRDFRINSLTLISSNGDAKDITNLVIEVQIRQDIHLGFISGEILITDGIDMHSRAFMHGNEYLYVDILEPQQLINIKKAFRIYKVANRTPIRNNAQRYVAYFVSDELIDSNIIKISKAYKSSTISNIAEDILTKYLSVPAERMKIDPTNEIVDVIIPNYRPLEALNWLATRAFNAEQSCYFFYENLEGYNFRSIQSIYKDGAELSTPYIFGSKSVSKHIESDKFAIDSFKVIRDFDVLNNVSNGGYAMKLLGVDPFNQEINVTEYGLDKISKLYPNSSMSNAVTKNGKSLFNEHDAHLLTYLQTTKTPTNEKNHTESWISRIMSVAALNNNLLEISVPGNMRLQIGKVITILFPYTVTPPIGDDIYDKRKSGNYLIIAVNHKFDCVNSRFESVIMIARDSVPEALPAIDQRLTAKIAKLNNL